MGTPAAYEAWYQTPRGAWIADREYRLMLSMMRPGPGESLLDVGCGTGHFSRRFANVGLDVTGADPDEAALGFARHQNGNVTYLNANALNLPFMDEVFDYCTAVTSLCFIGQPAQALAEMWRVCRKGVMLGLLNRSSRLYRERDRHPGYTRARWDTPGDVYAWMQREAIKPAETRTGTVVHFPKANTFSRIAEKVISPDAPGGAFLAVYLSKSNSMQ